jgi:hypothetical protein
MRNTIMTLSMLALTSLQAGCDGADKTKPAVQTDNPAGGREGAEQVSKPSGPPNDPGNASTPKKLFLDVHDLGPGKVTAEEVAGAHQKDLATQAKYDVDYLAYWFDEKEGKIYCLAEAPSAEAANAVHKEAHGLVADTIMEVEADNTNWTPAPGMKLFLDVHHLDASKVTAKDVAAAHQKDLATQAKYNVHYLNYWFDEKSGTVMCLAQAPNAQAAIQVHKEAHGLVPDSIEEVSEGH